MRVITNAGREGAVRVDARREAIRRIRQVVRRVDAPDDEVDDALEALVELAKTPE